MALPTARGLRATQIARRGGKRVPVSLFFREEETYLFLCLFSCRVDLKNY